jgi:hypothetical protein
VDEAANREEPLATLLALHDALEAAGIPYMVTGSVASFVYGLPRFTHDLDLVVQMRKAHIARLASELGTGWYVDSEWIEEAIARGSQFNVISHETGFKVDVWLLTDEPFDQSRFSRRRCEEIEGRGISVPSAEDAILAKLRWYKQAPSDRHLDDAREVWESFAQELDLDYLQDWADRLGIADILEEVRSP